MAKFCDVIRVLRVKRGYSQATLARKLGITRSALSNYELGIREPDMDTIELFADFFDVSMDSLTGREENDPAATPAPKTQEARIISEGVDRLPPKARKNALEFYNTLFKMLENEFREEDENDT